MDAELDIDDFLFWDVNDDSLFVENDEFLANFMAENSTGESAGVEGSHEGSHAGVRPAASKKHHKPMLSKDDKRRIYAKMFSEAFNSGDIKQLTNFVQSYCTAECVMIQKCVVAANSYIPKYVEVFGSSAILEFWANTFLTVPDCLMVMLETKLRIRTRQFQHVLSSNASATNNSNNNNSMSSNASKGSVDEIHNEGSSIVCSFSFTGTKIYTTKMEGAVTQPPGMVTNDNTTASTSLAASDSTSSMQFLESSGGHTITASQHQMSLAGLAPPKPPKQSKKRSFATISDSTGGSTTAIVGNNSSNSNNNSSGPNTSGPPESSIDKFNIFLHPPRKYSTLAGTPFGGSPHYYTKSHHGSNQHNQISQATKMSDYISINANTKFSTGSFMEQEGYINFLGTLTMTLDSDNKINKFEFIYSHMD